MKSNPADAPRIDLGVMDALRGLAALYVVLTHAAVLTWENAEHYVAATGQEAGLAFNLLTRSLEFGKPAVMLFFLISGFCIHYRQARMIAEAGPDASRKKILDVGSFAGRRIRRLYPPFLLALALTVLMDVVGSIVNPTFYAGQTAYWRINIWLDFGDYAPQTLLGNLLMQSSVVVPPLGSNGALWSLGYEFWFYALYPVVLLLSVRIGSFGSLAVVGVGGLLAGAAARLSGGLVPPDVSGVLFCWVVWTAGALLADAYVGRIRLAGIAWLAPLAVIGLVALVARRSILDGPPGIQAVLWGACLAILLGYLLLAAPRRVRVAAERAARSLSFLGGISYSLYLVHLPWLSLLGACWLAGHDRLPSGWELFAPGVVGALALGSATWFLVERHFVPRHAAQGPREPRLADRGIFEPSGRGAVVGAAAARPA